MSMLSAQCDELRWLADNLEEHDSHMDEYVQAMRRAAVTIWELRNKMSDMVDQREEAERLMAERDEWHRVAVSKQDIIDHMRDARAENAKLRALAAEAIRLMQADGPDCGLCKHYDECWTGEAMDYSPSGCVICTEARELGIEV